MIFYILQIYNKKTILAEPTIYGDMPKSGPASNYITLEDELSADRLVVAYLLDNSCESLGHGNDLYLAFVHVRI